MTDPTQNTGGASTDPLVAARAKLDEVIVDKSLPEDAIAVLIEGLNATDAQRTTVAALRAQVADTFSEYAEDVAGLADRLAALEAKPQQEISAAGLDLAPIRNALVRIGEARASGAIPGNIATILEDVFAGFGAREAPAAPLSEDEKQEITEAAENGQSVEEARAAEEAAAQAPPAGNDAGAAAPEPTPGG